MRGEERKRLIRALKKKMNLADGQIVIDEALAFFAWVLSEQEHGGSLYMERGGVLEDILLLYERSKKGASDVGRT